VLQFGAYPVYSVDASALIDFKDYYQEKYFPHMWDLVRNLANQYRLLICEEVDTECHDPELRELIEAHPQMVVGFGDMQDHFSRFMFEHGEHDLRLVHYGSLANKADPFVVALALMLDGRELRDLRQRTSPDAECVVVTEEKPSDAGAKRVQIPNVCDFYRLPCIRWLEMMKREGYVG
jgi:hypothetical protein